MEKEQILISKMRDKLNQYYASNKSVCTNFLDPLEQIEAEKVLKKIEHRMDGGYKEAERKIIIIGDSDINEYIKAIEINSKNQLEHRSILGSILGLGIKREMVGDILVDREKSYVLVKREIIDFILNNLRNIGRDKIELNIVGLNEIGIIEKENKIIKTTVASLRIDSLISSGFGISREEASSLIKNEKVSLNYKLVQSASKHVTLGDKISVRQYGRIELQNVMGETAKGRIRVEIMKL